MRHHPHWWVVFPRIIIAEKVREHGQVTKDRLEEARQFFGNASLMESHLVFAPSEVPLVF